MDTLKVGDLVETCRFKPGFITWISSTNPDECLVVTFGKHSDNPGGSHNIKKCGVHKITELRAMYLCVIPEEKLIDLWHTNNYSDLALKAEYDKIIQNDYMCK